MILDYRNFGELEQKYMRGRVLVDGREIRQVWYADDELGIVKTYDVFGNGGVVGTTVHGTQTIYTPANFPGREVDCPPDGVLSETLRGRVEIFPPEREKLQSSDSGGQLNPSDRT